MTETTALITLNHPFHVASGTIGKPLAGREVKLGPDGEVLVRGPMISTATWSGGELQAARRRLARHRRPRPGRAQRRAPLPRPQKRSHRHRRRRQSSIPRTSKPPSSSSPAWPPAPSSPIETPAGPEPCAVLAMRGAEDQAAAAIEHANARLADFQRIRRWLLWPEPDLPRTSTGKVRRKAVAAWLADVQAAANRPLAAAASGAQADWLLSLIAQITGEASPGIGDELRLSEDLHLDSLGRVQLAAALEQSSVCPPRAACSTRSRPSANCAPSAQARRSRGGPSPQRRSAPAHRSPPQPPSEPCRARKSHTRANVPASNPASARYVYPHWPWTLPFRCLRNAFIEAVMRPLVWLLAHPRADRSGQLPPNSAPMLIVANHVTAYDGPLIQYALPGRLRRRIAVAMSGEMLDDFRHARNPERGPNYGRFYPFGPLAYLLITALFNVFPLARRRDFLSSFAHAGRAMDRGFNVMVFPEGTRSATGPLAPFRGGIGVLVKLVRSTRPPRSHSRPRRIENPQRRWFRSGTIEVRVGQPIRFAPEETETQIATRLHNEVEKLLTTQDN